MNLTKQQAAMAAFAIMDQLTKIPLRYRQHIALELADAVPLIDPVIRKVEPGIAATDKAMEAFRQLLDILRDPAAP